MTDFPTENFNRTTPYNTGDNTAVTPVVGTETGSRAISAPPEKQPRPAPAVSVSGSGASRTALVVLAAIGMLGLAFVVMILVGVSSESINALAVFATPIASMVAAYYGITLSIQQVKNERAEKENAIKRADVADASSRETEVWAAQMESGLRVAMAKLTAAHIGTDEVTKAAGTPDGFF